MITPISSDRERVIPRWISLQASLDCGELSVPRRKAPTLNRATREAILLEQEEFEKSKSSSSALGLLEAAILFNNDDMAEEIIHNIEKHGIEFAPLQKLVSTFKNKSAYYLDEREISTRAQTAKLKRRTIMYPNDPLAWIELSRLYAIQGHLDHARRAAIISVNLAPYDRYVVRGAIRLFLHLHDYDIAYHYIRRANQLIADPWLKATEINVALIAKKQTPDYKQFFAKDILSLGDFHLSELIETHALLNLLNGNEKLAKKSFRAAWKQPSNNVITHSEWVIRNRIPSLKPDAILDFERSSEAITWIKYQGMLFDDALMYAERWGEEEPFSASPFVLGASIACSANKHSKGAEIAKRGLSANPGDTRLLNNLCYSLLRDGNVIEAAKYIQPLIDVVRRRELDRDYIVYVATTGLYYFKHGEIGKGREAYNEVIDICTKKRDTHLLAKAKLNLSLAELETSEKEPSLLVEEAMRLANNCPQPDTLSLASQISALMEKRKKHKLIT